MELRDSILLILEVIVLVVISGTCSGLNIAIMALDLADIRRKAKTGNHDAKAVLPLRTNYHLTLAAILFTNVGAVSAASLVMEDALNGFLAGILTTLLMVIFGEIVPQAIFAKSALKVTARLAPLMRLMIFVTFIVSKPLQLLLDRLFPPARRRLQTRHELGLLIAEHLGPQAESELDEDEVEIIRGALQLSEKHAREIMTPIKKVYWLTPGSVLDSEKINEITETGHSRIPILNKELTTCYGMLLTRDLIKLDPDTRPVVYDLPLQPTQTVGSMMALDTLFRKFINGQSHLSPVEKDDVIIGMVSIEDLLEEIVGREIEDEMDNRRRIARRR